MRILFTPAGDTDPVRGYHDGAILHILRHYEVDKVIVLLTKDMEEKEKSFHCYSRGIAQLCPDCVASFINCGITEPQDFEELTVIQNEFDKAFNDVQHQGAQWLLNVSSGTPQIKTVMTFLALDYSPHTKAIQVVNPAKKSNRDNSPWNTEEELADMLSHNEDDKPEAPNRTSEPPLLLLKKHSVKLQVVSLISNYEYHGALQLVSSNPALFTDVTKKLVEHAALRKDLMWRDAYKCVEEYKGNALIEIPDDFSEYFQVMELCQRKKQLPEFMLKLSPLLTELGKKYLESIEGFCLNDCGYPQTRAGLNQQIRITCSKLGKHYPDLLAFLNKNFKKGFRDCSLTFNLTVLMCEFFKTTKLGGDKRHLEISELFSQLRQVEENVRNPLAHNLTNITDKEVIRITGMDSTDILKRLHKIVALVRGEDIQCKYDCINEYILDSLKE